MPKTQTLLVLGVKSLQFPSFSENQAGGIMNFGQGKGSPHLAVAVVLRTALERLFNYFLCRDGAIVPP